jgi:hypothetical protein
LGQRFAAAGRPTPLKQRRFRIAKPDARVSP